MLFSYRSENKKYVKYQVPRVTLHHGVSWLEASVSDLSHGELFMISFLSRDDRSIGDQGEVDPGVGDQVGLELSQINIESSIKPERCGDGGDNLTNQTIQIGVGGSLNVQVPAADVVDGLIVHHEGAVGVLQGGVGGEDGVVRLNHRSGHLGSRVDGELQLGLLAVVHGETLHQQRSESGSSSSSEGVEDEETLETSALISQLPDPVKNQVNNLLANGVVTPGVVVGGVLLAIDQLFRMEELTIGSNSGLVNDRWFQVNEDSSWNMFPCSCLREEGGEGIVSKGFV